MSLFGRLRWFGLAAGITLAFAVVSLTVPRGPVLTAISDVGYLLLMLAVSAGMLANAWSAEGVKRRFWTLMGSGGILWACHQTGWVYYEVVHQTTVPNPWFMNAFLFLHLIPMIGGWVAPASERK